MQSQDIYVMDNRGIIDGPFKCVSSAFTSTQENYKDQHYTFHGKVHIVGTLMELDDYVYNGCFNDPQKVAQVLAPTQSSEGIRRSLTMLTTETLNLLSNICQQMAGENEGGIYEIDLYDHSVRSAYDNQLLITGLTFDPSRGPEPMILTEDADTGVFGMISTATADLTDLLFVLEYIEAARSNGNHLTGRLVLANMFTERFVREAVKAHYGDELPGDWKLIAANTFTTLISDHRGMPLDAELVKANI